MTATLRKGHDFSQKLRIHSHQLPFCISRSFDSANPQAYGLA